MDPQTVGIVVLLFVASLLASFIPTFLAFSRGHRNRSAILVCSVLASIFLCGCSNPSHDRFIVQVQVIPGSAAAQPNAVVQFKALGGGNNGGVSEDITGSVQWGSSNPGVAAISASGLATMTSACIGGEFTTITATSSSPGHGNAIGTAVLLCEVLLPPSFNLTGSWTFTFAPLAGSAYSGTIPLGQNGNLISGTFSSSSCLSQELLNGTISGSTVAFQLQKNNQIITNMSGSAESTVRMAGTYSGGCQNNESGNWTATSP